MLHHTEYHRDYNFELVKTLPDFKVGKQFLTRFLFPAEPVLSSLKSVSAERKSNFAVNLISD